MLSGREGSFKGSEMESRHPYHAAGRVAEWRLHLRAPLVLSWVAKGLGGPVAPLDDGARVLAGSDSGVICLERGRELWRSCDSLTLVAGGSVFGTDQGKFVELDLSTGRVVRSADCSFVLNVLLPERRAFLGCRASTHEDSYERDLALIALDGLELLWLASSRGSADDVFALDCAIGDGSIFVCKGGKFVALDLETGEQRWAVALEEFGEQMLHDYRPKVSAHRVVIGAMKGTVAFDTATGEVVWFARGNPLGQGAVYGGRVYAHSREFVVLDLNDGRVLLQTKLETLIEKKWGFRDVDFAGMAVSETHFFIGDGRGRLYAFEKETGEPVWYHQPKGGNGYFSAIPVIAGNRLYVTTASRPRKPGALYCYEQAEEGGSV